MNAINLQNVTIHNHTELTANGDWVLVELVGEVNVLKIEVGIVLNFGGILLTGTLVGGARYFDEVKQQMTAYERIDGSLDSTLERIVDQGKSLYNVAAKDGMRRPPEYLHLIDVHFPSNVNDVGTVKLSTWRGKIADVCGFHLHIAAEAPELRHATMSRGSGDLGSSVLGVCELERAK
ncbi:hypothetical protein [Janthinobacterium lividum]|uniref:hypothetical protein n=1 Tax=Janthinobacterium lividum TaxID=29581 RepID=UPI000873531B|nr:hypothetical protein [Janthinobacterium lividum]MCC7713403.1 hypothetical protein [Janthinobacterium lividum]WQE26468.1 hypothetical protein U0004_15835 [Janthinobacterium lividum]